MDRTPTCAWDRTGALLIAAVAWGCSISSLVEDERPIPQEVDQVPVLPDAIVPALLPFVDGSGLFRYPLPNVPAGEVPYDTALVQAREFLFYALNITTFRALAESQRGAFIDLGKLVACNRSRLARSAYDPPPDSVPALLQTTLGDYWQIPFCGDRLTPEVIVSVAARNNQFRYRNGQPVGVRDTLGGAYRVHGLPWEWRTEHVVTAEEAVNTVYGATGIRAERVPELVPVEKINGRTTSGYPACPVWRIALATPVRLATVYSQRRLEQRELYVTDSGCAGPVGWPVLLTTWHEQPPTREFRVWTGDRFQVYLARYRSAVELESINIER
jgi:hypothetical protein